MVRYPLLVTEYTSCEVPCALRTFGHKALACGGLPTYRCVFSVYMRGSGLPRSHSSTASHMFSAARLMAFAAGGPPSFTRTSSRCDNGAEQRVRSPSRICRSLRICASVYLPRLYLRVHR